MNKNQKKKERQDFFTNLLRFLILILVFLLIITLFYLFYNFFWLKYQESRIVNYNINLHNQLERKSSEILDKVNRNISFTGQNSTEIKQDLEIAKQENAKLSEIIADYESKSSDLKSSSNPDYENLREKIKESFLIKKEAITDFQEVNNYLICLGEKTVLLVVLQEKITPYNQDPDLLNSQGAIDKANREIQEDSNKAIVEMQKIPECFSNRLSPYLDQNLLKIIQDSSIIIEDQVKIQSQNEQKTAEVEIPLFESKNRKFLESPLNLLSQSEEKLKNVNQNIETAISEIEKK